MPPNIPSDLLPRARQIILPMVGTEDEREALLTDSQIRSICCRIRAFTTRSLAPPERVLLHSIGISPV